jgi:hypothetical protein
MELEGSQSSHYSHAIFAVPQANHIPTNLYIRGEDGAYGGGSTKGVSVYIHGGDNTTSTNQGDVILAHDGSSGRGNVGIGTTSPSAKLELAGTYGNTKLDGHFIGFTRASANYLWANATGGDLRFTVNGNAIGSPSMIINTSGNVGIGTTSVSAKLDVRYDSSKDGIFLKDEAGGAVMLFGADGNNNARARFYNGLHSQNIEINSNTGSPTYFNAGKVGIGTTSPSRPLHVLFSGDSGTRIESTDSHSSLYIESHSGKGQYIRFSENTADKYWINSSGGKLYFRPAATGTAANQVIFDSSGNVGIGTTNPCSKLEVNGHFAATSKSFIIDHPTQKDKKLQYASLEGPENGVYVRGTTDEETIDLPEYWSELVHEDSITVVLTPIGKKQDLFIKEKSNKLIKIGGAEGSFDYVVYGERKDIDKLEIEPLKV